MKANVMPDLITDKAKGRIESLAEEMEAGVQGRTMGRAEIAKKTSAMIADIFEDWKGSLIPDDVEDPTKYRTAQPLTCAEIVTPCECIPNALQYAR